MKRLFQVNDRKGNPVKNVEKEPLYFDSKTKAKGLRNTLNSEAGEGHTVSPGPDHKGKLSKKSRGHIRANRKES